MIKTASKKIDDKHYTGHLTFWQYAKSRFGVNRPAKYCIIFNTWKDIYEYGSFSCTEYDTLDGVMEEVKLLNEMYCNTPKPQKVYSKNGKHKDGIGWRYDNYDWDFSNGKHFWGYVVLDMINCKFVKIVHGLNNKVCLLPKNPGLKSYDLFFRGEDEIPIDYQWDVRGEYDGWIQFRWGDGKNALDYVEPENNDKIIKPIVKTSNIIDEDDYSEDYLPCTLAEEIAVDEYIDNGGSFDKKTTTSSIADMLGDDNPLFKLKFN